MPDRCRLPNRRNAVTEALVIGNITIVATIGFDAAGRPAEIFPSGVRDGSGLASDFLSIRVTIVRWMKRLRSRRRNGLRCYIVEVKESEVDKL